MLPISENGPLETGLITDCLAMVAEEELDRSRLGGVVVLDSRKVQEDGFVNRESILLEIATGQIITRSEADENWIDFFVSPNQELMAIGTVRYSPTGQVVQEEVVVMNSLGERVVVVPRQPEWYSLVGWVSDQEFMIGLDELNGEKFIPLGQPSPRLIYNLFDGTQRVLQPEFSRFSEPRRALPYWRGQWGVVYNASLTRAIYPRYLDDEGEFFTMALWDLEENELIRDFGELFFIDRLGDDIFPESLAFSDGDDFLFGNVRNYAEQANTEIYKISGDGQLEQITDLDIHWSIKDGSWSPDGRYLAAYLSLPGTDSGRLHVAVMDMDSHVVTNYCITVEGYIHPLYSRTSPAQWSPDGKHLLVADRDDKGDYSTLLISLEQKVAVVFTPDFVPVVWLK
jgi:hypothetical protein